MAKKRRSGKPTQEQFDLQKFFKGTDLLNPVGWAKTGSHSLRMLLIVAILAGGWGFWKGYQRKPVFVDLDDSVIEFIDRQGAEHKLVIKDRQISIDGKRVNTGNVENLRPFGIELKPKLAAGITSAGNPAGGLALEVAHFYAVNLDLLAMFPFVGVGTSYDLNIDALHIRNTAVGLGIGRDLEANAPAAIAYVTIRF